jgi:phosphopantetheine adenylyltransferase
LANFRKIEVQMDVINEELNEEVEKVFFEPNTGKIAI